ncbi:hypothetical protein KEM52_001368, partial [Ascosphaera acerosa]
SRPESEEFFKVIMGFPSPKPRNIEKDVKVFPWKVLAHALKKIIGKYSASYTTTVTGIAPSMAAGYANAVISEHLPHGMRPGSPGSAQPSAMYNPHFPNMSTPRLSSHVRGSSAISLASAASLESCPSSANARDPYMPTSEVNFQRRPYSFSYQNNGAGGIPVTVAPATRAGSTLWDFSSYVQTAPSTPEFINSSEGAFNMTHQINENSMA